MINYISEGEKELFKKMLPVIDDIRKLIKCNNIDDETEHNIILCINNEIYDVCKFREKEYQKKINNGYYHKFTRQIDNPEIRKNINQKMKELKYIAQDFKKEYFEEI